MWLYGLYPIGGVRPRPFGSLNASSEMANIAPRKLSACVARSGYRPLDALHSCKFFSAV